MLTNINIHFVCKKNVETCLKMKISIVVNYAETFKWLKTRTRLGIVFQIVIGVEFFQRYRHVVMMDKIDLKEYISYPFQRLVK